MIDKLQQLTGETKIKSHQYKCNSYDQKNSMRKINKFMFDETSFSKTAESISKIYPEVRLKMKFLQTKP